MPVHPSRRFAILAVCTGNICRSPTGEGVLRTKAKARGLDVLVASAGTHDYHVGEPPDPRTIRHASKRGYDLSAQRARQVSARDFQAFDHILAMDGDHLRQLKALAPQDARARLGLFLDLSQAWPGKDVPDPYYGDAAGFERVLDMVEEASELWIERIAREVG